MKPTITDTAFIGKLKSKINDGLPMSLVRYGDGELNVLRKRLTSYLENYFTKVCGYKDPHEGMADCRKILLKTLNEADVIGVMGDNEITQNLPNVKKWQFDEKFLRESKRQKNVIAVDNMVVRGQVLGDVKELKKLINGRPVCIVTGVADKLKENEISKHLETKVRLIKTPWGIRLDKREKIFKELDTIKEDIVLVGCSLIGKDFCTYLRRKGKVCLDVGAILDAWAGIITRPWFREGKPQSHCLIRKDQKEIKKIFCIGYNKTGTTSLYRAIEELGFKGCNLRKGEDLLYSIKANEWNEVYKFCSTAQVFKDIPFSLPSVWKKLYETYPNAKFILSERDDADQWFNSIKNFHKKGFGLSDDPTWEDIESIEYVKKGFVAEYMKYTFGKPDKPYDKQSLIESYKLHNSEIKKFFKGKENFITVNVSNNDDYQRLCKFLNKPVSKDSKFPHYKKT